MIEPYWLCSMTGRLHCWKWKSYRTISWSVGRWLEFNNKLVFKDARSFGSRDIWCPANCLAAWPFTSVVDWDDSVNTAWCIRSIRLQITSAAFAAHAQTLLPSCRHRHRCLAGRRWVCATTQRCGSIKPLDAVCRLTSGESKWRMSLIFFHTFAGEFWVVYCVFESSDASPCYTCNQITVYVHWRPLPASRYYRVTRAIIVHQVLAFFH